MTGAIQFPSPALWHRVLSGPPVGRDQGTRNPIGGFNDMVQTQLARQNALAGLQPPPPALQSHRAPQIQRAPEKDPRERNRNSQGQQHEQPGHGSDGQDRNRQAGARREADAAVMRALWA